MTIEGLTWASDPSAPHWFTLAVVEPTRLVRITEAHNTSAGLPVIAKDCTKINWLPIVDVPNHLLNTVPTSTVMALAEDCNVCPETATKLKVACVTSRDVGVPGDLHAKLTLLASRGGVGIADYLNPVEITGAAGAICVAMEGAGVGVISTPPAAIRLESEMTIEPAAVPV